MARQSFRGAGGAGAIVLPYERSSAAESEVTALGRACWPPIAASKARSRSSRRACSWRSEYSSRAGRSPASFPPLPAQENLRRRACQTARRRYPARAFRPAGRRDVSRARRTEFAWPSTSHTAASESPNRFMTSCATKSRRHGHRSGRRVDTARRSRPRVGTANRALLAKRNDLQAQIDQWLAARRGQPIDAKESHAFLSSIGYIVPTGAPFRVATANVDPEIATLAGPQLVVPVDNPRYALNAANSRWGSLYDALYGTNVIPEDGGADKGRGYNPVRGERVIARANQFLDDAVPLASGAWSQVAGVAVDGGKLAVTLAGDRRAGLRNPQQFVGYRARAAGSRTCCCATTDCTWISRSIRIIRSVSVIPRASKTSCSRAQCPRSWIARIRLQR